MPITHGADPDQLDALAHEMTASADQLRDLHRRIDARLQQTPWLGTDVEGFRNEWTSRHGRAITTTATGLDAAARAAAPPSCARPRPAARRS